MFITNSNINILVTILRFMSPLATADNCQSASGLVGSCLSAQDCIKRGGRGVETCAWGLGVCCVRKCLHKFYSNIK